MRITYGMKLHYECMSSVADVVIRLIAWMAEDKKGTKPSAYPFDFNTVIGRARQEGDFVLPAGELIAITAIGHSGGPARGAVYVNLSIIRRVGVFVHLCSGYVSVGRGIWWTPNHAISEDSPDGRGVSYVVNIVDPAPGAELIITVPVGAIWRILSIRAILLTDANAANRQIQLVLDDSSNNVFTHAFTGIDHTATVTRRYHWVQGYPIVADAAFDGDSSMRMFLPNWRLEELMRLRTSTTAIQVGDQYSDIFLHLEEWLQA